LLVLIQAPLGAQQSGLLLGVDLSSSDFSWDSDPQTFRTYWIVGSARGAVVQAVLPGLLVPQERGFLRAGIMRSCGRNAEHGFTFCNDAYWTGPANQKPPAAPPLPQDTTDDERPCSFETVRIQFLAPKAVALWRHSGNSEVCEPRGFRFFESAWLQEVTGSDTRLKFTDIAGSGARSAYAQAARAAEAELNREFDIPCEVSGDQDDQWTVERRAGRWRPRLFQQNGHGHCATSAEIALALPALSTGPDRLARPWHSLSEAIPLLRDAVSSPDGTWSIAITDSALVFTTGQPGTRKVVATVPRARVVLAQWALGRNVARWDAVVKKAGNRD
jgi:hypothetical protein